MMTQKPPLGGKLALFETVKEDWNEYDLADGNTLRLKTVLLKVLDTGTKNPTGEPRYNFQTHIIANVFTPEQGYVKLKK